MSRDLGFEQALVAKNKLVPILHSHSKVNGVGVGKVRPGVYFIVVNLREALGPEDALIPDKIDDFEVQTKVVGEVRALGSVSR